MRERMSAQAIALLFLGDREERWISVKQTAWLRNQYSHELGSRTPWNHKDMHIGLADGYITVRIAPNGAGLMRRHAAL